MKKIILFSLFAVSLIGLLMPNVSFAESEELPYLNEIL
ncbi:hypothetical protein LSPCS325_14130 [Lysinibacillus sp. CTST325]